MGSVNPEGVDQPRFVLHACPDEFCDAVFPTLGDLAEHANQDHTEEDWLRWDRQCEATFEEALEDV